MSEKVEDRVLRVHARTLELCDRALWDPGALELARKVWLDAQETRMHAVSKERMMAFAEELFRQRHPGARTTVEGPKGRE